MRRSWQIGALLILVQACGSSTDQGPATLDDSIEASLEAFGNRTIYTSLDPQILAAISDDDLELAVVDYVSSKLEGHYDQEERIVNGLPEGTRALYLTWVVEAEVNNGGFNQYYWNTDSRFATEAVEAFELFGANQHAALMREANAVRRAEAEAISEFEAQGTIEAFSESYQVSKLGSLDERFYKLEDI